MNYRVASLLKIVVMNDFIFPSLVDDDIIFVTYLSFISMEWCITNIISAMRISLPREGKIESSINFFTVTKP